MTNDGPPNPTSPPTQDEETPTSSVDPPFWIDKLPEYILSGVEGAVPGKTPPIKMDEDPVLSLSKEPPLQDEIDLLRLALQRLVKSFSNTETLEEQFKLSSAINFTTASLVRLIRAQKLLRDHQPNTNEQAVDRAITAVLKEWGRI